MDGGRYHRAEVSVRGSEVGSESVGGIRRGVVAGRRGGASEAWRLQADSSGLDRCRTGPRIRALRVVSNDQEAHVPALHYLRDLSRSLSMVLMWRCCEVKVKSCLKELEVPAEVLRCRLLGICLASSFFTCPPLFKGPNRAETTPSPIESITRSENRT